MANGKGGMGDERERERVKKRSEHFKRSLTMKNGMGEEGGWERGWVGMGMGGDGDGWG